MNHPPRRKRFLVDVDEVLIDFQTAVFDIFERLSGRRLTAHAYDVWDVFSQFTADETDHIRKEIAQPGFCRSLKPFPSAQAAIEQLRSMVDVYAVTAPFKSQTWAFERNESLKEHFGFDKRSIVQTNAKFLIAGDYLLDDCPTYLTEWAAEHPESVSMLWHLPNTRLLDDPPVYSRVHTWDEVLTKVRSTL